MKIDVDCPGCGKRYQVDESFGGKRSALQALRKFVSHSARSRSSRRRGSAESPVGDSVSYSRSVQSSPVPPAEVAAPVSQASGPSKTVVFNCPRCFKRYEVDAALGGKEVAMQGLQGGF